MIILQDKAKDEMLETGIIRKSDVETWNYRLIQLVGFKGREKARSRVQNTKNSLEFLSLAKLTLFFLLE